MSVDLTLERKMKLELVHAKSDGAGAVQHPHFDYVDRITSAPPATADHLEKLAKEHERMQQLGGIQRATPFFRSQDGKWTGVVSNHFALGNPLIRGMIVPPGRMEGHHGDDWHHRLNRFLHHHKTHFVLNILLILDVLIIIIAIQLELAFLESEIKDLEHACEHDPPEHCPSHPGNQSLEEAAHILEYFSVAILCIFALDNILLLVANGKNYFKNPLYVFDAVVVFLAIIFETALSDAVAVGIIVVIRSWRFVRIGHGVYETTHHVEPIQEKNGKSKRDAAKQGSVSTVEPDKLKIEIKETKMVTKK
mmetsp:Transcript_2238/g.5103  ORF Transcript_2238/g.5103 Transcript_2238/m.5103 type:complete len:307 (+) Transcript_2238:247-1167(+)|eukprot:CAMPEP_0114499402 /NCGR_PEP_ID=MMETSP0109-20121206/7398_1 /TAXON_ID=29199 /ORGANISM="Chlorarachnion reptans, Strain CCCM449" /LENGTH=306 /DNA_ID=CAMNT_0001676967 /DNA_START=251 /DNA_END=1171 /DNA_ORIENTATION=-